VLHLAEIWNIFHWLGLCISEDGTNKRWHRAMRNYIRHPTDIPVQVAIQAGPAPQRRQVDNLSRGGLAFITDCCLDKGMQIRISIDVVDPRFEAEAIVTHCRRRGGQFLVGVEFIHRDDLYIARMVEQVCHIQRYRQHIEELEGRQLSTQEAANEWIRKYAGRFPRWGT